MKVTEIEAVSKSRAKVYIDEKFAFVLYKGELRSFQIREGEEVSEEDYRNILEEVLPKRAKRRAMNLLKSREYTVRQLHDKLRDGGYPEKSIEQALDYVAGFHYTDDLRYAAAFIRNHEGNRSRRRIEQDLAGRGIDRDVLERAWGEWEAEGGSQDERQRMYGFLMRRGFSAELVRRAVLSGRSCCWD